MEHAAFQQFVYLFWIPFFPLLGAVYNGLLGSALQRRLGEKWIHAPAIVFPMLSFIITIAGFVKLTGLDPHSRALYCNAWSWLHIGNLNVDIAFWMDPLGAVMAFVVTFVGTLIHIYSIGYMRNDPGYWRFFSYMNLFMFSMLILVLGDNFLMMFIGWEGVGLCSYLLIGFWYKDEKNAVAGMKAFIVNRVGDFGFIIGVFLLFWGLGFSLETFDSSSLATVTSEETHLNSSLVIREIEESLQIESVHEAFTGKKIFGFSLVTLICVCLFVGAMGKSAQIPLYVWLPDAMAGPTPVSALIHAATMVTAGVYMVARLHFLFALSPFAMTWVALFGAVTALYAATIGFFQYDIKKVLAYSTISQLGYMFIGVGVGAFSTGIFHLMTHAFFKGCLFLSAGSIIIGCHHQQDMRKMGGLKTYMPVTRWAYLMACFAIAGFPFFSGFFSKDEILWQAFNSKDMMLPGGGKIIWLLGIVGALCTSFYMFRSYFMTFTGEYSENPHHVPKESPKQMTCVLVILGFLSIFSGFVGMPHLWHVHNLFETWMEPVFESSSSLIASEGYTHTLEWMLMGISVAVAIIGAWVAGWLYKNRENPLPGKLLASKKQIIRIPYNLIYNKYYVDEIYQHTIVWLIMNLRLALDWFDRKIIDQLVDFAGTAGRWLGRFAGYTDEKGVDGAVNATSDMVIFSGLKLVTIQTGKLRNYLGVVLAGAIILVIANYLFF
ncbi:MAG: hypothetical protein A2V65_06115 [Deltaproteobacteria bacterium RBG_13_49_15]|nr:MAG: hypothetical protein A2V65_06115 [Deltaproteobacteria bacterium RBG_13_49_15]